MLSDSDAVADEKSRQAELDDLENVAQKAIQKELKAVLMGYLNTVKPSKKNLSKDDFTPNYTLTKTSPEAVLSTERLIGTSFLLGMEHAERDKKAKEISATDTKIPPIAFSEAINFLKSKVPITKDDWLKLEPKLRFRAFTVAKLAECDFINTAHTQLLGAFEDGTGYADFWNRIKATVNDNVFDIRPGYWENVYRTNTQSAYIAGKLQQFEKTNPVAYRLLVIDDSRTSDICRHLVKESGYGVVLPESHNFWKKYGYPPYHFQCRTGIQGVYKSQISNDKDLMPENVPMKNFNKFHVQDGFGGNPLEKESWWKELDSQKKRATLYGVQGDIEDVYYGLFNKKMEKSKIVTIPTTNKKITIDKGKKVLISGLMDKATTESQLRELGEHIYTIAEKENVSVIDVMKEFKSFGTNKKLQFTSDSNILAKNNIQSALNYFPTKTANKIANYKHAVKAEIAERGWFYKHDSGAVSIGLGENTMGNGAEVHELGHFFEKLYPWIVQVEKEFYDRRTAGEELQLLRDVTKNDAYGEWEETRVDNFLNPYIGKDCKGKGFEVFSTGLEQLFYGTMGEKRLDFEYENLIMGIIARL